MASIARRPVEILTRRECVALMRACGRGPTGVRNMAAIAVMWRAGLRCGEMLALKPKDIDMERRTVRVLYGKGNRARTVALDPEAIAVVEKWLAVRKKLTLRRGATLFCTMQGRPMKPDYLRALLPRLAKRASIQKRVHAHAFRHTFAVELSEENVPIHVIQRVLGHAHLTTTSGYLARFAPREAIMAISARTWGVELGRGRRKARKSLS